MVGRHCTLPYWPCPATLQFKWKRFCRAQTKPPRTVEDVAVGCWVHTGFNNGRGKPRFECQETCHGFTIYDVLSLKAVVVYMAHNTF